MRSSRALDDVIDLAKTAYRSQSSHPTLVQDKRPLDEAQKLALAHYEAALTYLNRQGLLKDGALEAAAPQLYPNTKDL